jgi:hypothetical protein
MPRHKDAHSSLKTAQSVSVTVGEAREPDARGAVVNTIASHDACATSSVQGFDHTDFGFGGATSDDDRELGKLVNLGVGERVELRSRLCEHQFVLR